jgi:hypothetical protein
MTVGDPKHEHKHVYKAMTFSKSFSVWHKAIQLYTESVQGGIPQRNVNPPGILFLLLNANAFLGIDDLPMALIDNGRIYFLQCIGED